jgi:hypothetical protein
MNVNAFGLAAGWKLCAKMRFVSNSGATRPRPTTCNGASVEVAVVVDPASNVIADVAQTSFEDRF